MAKTAHWLAGALLLLLAHPSHAAQVRDAEFEVQSKRLFPAIAAAVTSVRPTDRIENRVVTMLAERRQRMTTCNHVPKCLFAAAIWRAQERELLATYVETSNQHPSPKRTIPDDGLRAEVIRELLGLNHILDVYGLGRPPLYPEIDGTANTSDATQFGHYTAEAVALGEAAQGDPAVALDRSLGLALALLDAADRNNASAFEPLDERYNAAAILRASKIDWMRYAYTAIILPGIGPDDLTTPLSATGKLNVRMAATRYADGVAPFIIVTGGKVHPRGTRYAEALEMRRALIDRYHIPADCIVVEPYARHTTTNLRNATRRLAALGAPMDRAALIVTYPEQSQYIESAEFSARNLRELGYQPGAVGARLSATELVFRPNMASLRVDPMDPLDP